MSDKNNKINYKEIEEKVFNYKTKYKEGYVEEDVKKLLSEYENVNMKKFNGALGCHTVIMKNDEFVTYHDDILTALICGLENRDITTFEFD